MRKTRKTSNGSGTFLMGWTIKTRKLSSILSQEVFVSVKNGATKTRASLPSRLMKPWRKTNSQNLTQSNLSCPCLNCLTNPKRFLRPSYSKQSVRTQRHYWQEDLTNMRESRSSNQQEPLKNKRQMLTKISRMIKRSAIQLLTSWGPSPSLGKAIWLNSLGPKPMSLLQTWQLTTQSI